MAELSTDDIRASVAAGIIDEAQAASILSVAQDRLGFRVNMGSEDEPFELFRGFSEIFVTVGLLLLTSGIVGLGMTLGGPISIPIVSALLSVLFARYFTISRRMTLPSIFLATTFGVSTFVCIGLILNIFSDTGAPLQVFVAFLLTAALLGFYFKYFRVPFVLFLIGLCGMGMAYALANFARSAPNMGLEFSSIAGKYLDLGKSPLLALALLAFGICAFFGAMYFDLKDPYRISRRASSAFWLHILAAPAIVNVVAASLLGIGGVVGYLLATFAILFISVIALVIDRRSFLTAGIIYIGAILTWVISSTNVGRAWSFVLILLTLGVFVTALGSWWVQIRASLMRRLPEFPYKNQLPPFEEMP